MCSRAAPLEFPARGVPERKLIDSGGGKSIDGRTAADANFAKLVCNANQAGESSLVKII
jgi:hypothetical protein